MKLNSQAALHCSPHSPCWQQAQHSAQVLCFTLWTCVVDRDSLGHRQRLHCWELILQLHVKSMMVFLPLPWLQQAGRHRVVWMDSTSPMSSLSWAALSMGRGSPLGVGGQQGAGDFIGSVYTSPNAVQGSTRVPAPAQALCCSEHDSWGALRCPK